MPTEVQVRHRLADVWRLIPELEDRIHDRGRSAVTDEEKAKLCFRASDGIVIGGILRLISPPREDFVKINLVRRSFVYTFETLLTARDRWDDTPQSSEDYLINTLVEPLYALIRERVDLGFPGQPERVEHQLMQGGRDFTIPKSNELGAVHVSATTLEVHVYVSAVQLCQEI